MMLSNPVLLAIPEEWNKLHDNELFSNYLVKEGFSIVFAFSYKEALDVIQSKDLVAVVMCSDWAMKQEDGSPGLFELLRDKTPTLSLITDTTQKGLGYQWFDELYDRPQHEYQTMPAAIDQIAVWLHRIAK